MKISAEKSDESNSYFFLKAESAVDALSLLQASWKPIDLQARPCE